MRIIECEQGTPEWIEARCGRLTASRIADAVARTKSGWGASRANYMAELIAERLTGCPTEAFTSLDMRWGIEKEPEARELYGIMHGLTPRQVGFVLHPRLDWAGASPDGLIGEDGLIEIKCPKTATHIDTLLGAPIDDRYVKQMQWQMLCTNREWCDFVSYDPRMPAEMQISVQRVTREEALIRSLETDVIAFLAEIEDRVARLGARFLQAAE